MAPVSARYLELARTSKRGLDAVFAAGTAPDVAMLSGYEFRGYNQPQAAALLGIRKFIKAFYVDASGRSFGCNTRVTQNGLNSEWLARPSAEHPKRYAFFQVEAASPDGDNDLQRKAALLDYSRGDNPAYDVSRILRDYLVRVHPDTDDLLLGKAFFVVAQKALASSYFVIERYRPLPDASRLAAR